MARVLASGLPLVFVTRSTPRNDCAPGTNRTCDQRFRKMIQGLSPSPVQTPVSQPETAVEPSREVTTDFDENDHRVPPKTPAETHGAERSQNASDPIEVALAEALARASSAGEWAVVSLLAGELAARRATRQGAA